MKTTIFYKGYTHYISEIDPGCVTLKTVLGNRVHRQQIARSDPEEQPTWYVFTDWVTLTLPEFGNLLRDNGFTRKNAEAMLQEMWETK